MTDDSDALIRELTTLTRYADAVRNMMSSASAQAPQQAVGADPTGTVSVSIDAAGLPERITVRTEWIRRLDPAELGPAVALAYERAMSDRLTGWEETLHSSGWAADFEEFKEGMESGVLPQSGPLTPTLPEASTAPTRPLSEVTEDAISAFDVLPTLPTLAELGRVSEGSVARGRLTLRLSRDGGLSAEIDPEWAERQSAAGLMTHLDQALGIIRLKASREDTRTDPTAGLSSLLAEALALIKQPH